MTDLTNTEKRQQAQSALNALYTAAASANLPAQQHEGLKQAAEFLANLLGEVLPDEKPKHEPDHYAGAPSENAAAVANS